MVCRNESFLRLVLGWHGSFGCVAVEEVRGQSLVLLTASFFGRMLFLGFGSWKLLGRKVSLARQGGEGDRVGQLRKREVVGLLRLREAKGARFVPSGLGDHSVASAGWGSWFWTHASASVLSSAW